MENPHKSSAVGMSEVRALTFDVFGTTVDWRSGVAAEAPMTELQVDSDEGGPPPLLLEAQVPSAGVEAIEITTGGKVIGRRSRPATPPRIDFAGQRGVFAKSHAATTGVIVDQELRQNALQMAYCQKTQTKAIRTEMWTCVARTNELG